MYRSIRAFFDNLDALEVETPVLSRASALEPHLQPFYTAYAAPGCRTGETLFLQTSPEFAMKRLVAAGAGSVYQICKAFRNGERGGMHNPEFSMLEYYRVGFSLRELATELDRLLRELIGEPLAFAPSEWLTYRDCFSRWVGVDPVESSVDDFDAAARRVGLVDGRRLCGEQRAAWLEFLFSHVVQPQFSSDRLTFVFDFPACLPSLAERKHGDDQWVERLEVFWRDMELANGFQELLDAEEQHARFTSQWDDQAATSEALRAIDTRLISALASGMPRCSGIAIGLDRLLMVRLRTRNIDDVLAFPLERA